MKTRFAVVLCLSALPVFAADYPGALKVTFRTTDCAGATGLASVEADRITRIQPYSCADGKALKQVLTQSAKGIGEAYTITAAEADHLQAQIDRIMESRRKALEQNRPPVIIKH